MYLQDIETIYKIEDLKDKYYKEWYGTFDDVDKYLTENLNKEDYNDCTSIFKGLELLNLTFEIIN